MKIYTVHCKCPTPLAANPYATLAKSEQVAIQRFFLRNGISGSDHPITVAEGNSTASEAEVDPVEEVEVATELPPVKPKSEADQIREYLAVHPGAANKDVIAALKATGVEITSSQVSTIKKSMSEAGNESSGDAGSDQG